MFPFARGADRSYHPMKDQPHKARKVQVRDLVRAQQEQELLSTEYPKPDWWREEIHGASALAERQRLRREGKINRRKWPVGPMRGLHDLAQAIMRRTKDSTLKWIPAKE